MLLDRNESGSPTSSKSSRAWWRGGNGRRSGRLAGPAGADRRDLDLATVREGVGGPREGEKAGGEVLGHRAGGLEIAVFLAVVLEAARDDDLKVGDMGPRPGRPPDQGYQDGTATVTVDAEGDDEGDWQMAGVRMDEHSWAAALGAAVEGDEAGVDVEGSLIGDEDPGKDTTSANR